MAPFQSLSLAGDPGPLHRLEDARSQRGHQQEGFRAGRGADDQRHTVHLAEEVQASGVRSDERHRPGQTLLIIRMKPHRPSSPVNAAS